MINLISTIKKLSLNLSKLYKRVFSKNIPVQRPPEYLFPERHRRNILSKEDWSGKDYITNKPKSSRRTIIRTKGKVHNLKKIFNRLNKEHFDGKIKAKITWGKYGCRNVKRETSILFGTYSSSELLIRIHPAMDSKEVPEYFIEHVIHHEILHEVIPPIRGNGSKWMIHHYEFRVAEAATPSYKKAMEWEQLNTNKVFFKSPIKPKNNSVKKKKPKQSKVLN